MGSLLVNGQIVNLPVFTALECSDIGKRLEACRGKWLMRGPGFATIGVATYLDVMCSDNPAQTYYGRLEEQNRLLSEEFGDVLERACNVLGDYLNEPWRFDSGVALPGFHIFEGIGIPTASWPNQHFDLQHRALNWAFGPVDEDRLISFTLALQLPAEGGGLEYWDVTEAELARLERLGRQVTMETLGKVKPVRRNSYALGSMSLQTSPVMHRIAPVRQVTEGDQRITVQGHGVWDGRSWVVYW